VLRVGWLSGHGLVVAPRMARALAHLDGSVRVAEPTRRERPDWRKLNADDVDELARELVQVHGAALEATALLVRAGGMTNADATALIGRFEQERAPLVKGGRSP
jgi:hypothetical protein